MAKKKKVYNSETGEAMEQGQEPVVMNEFVLSFCDTFVPCEREEEAEEVFTMGALRQYFKAYTTPGTPDALPDYLKLIGQHGFVVRTSYCGEPAVFARWNNFPIGG